jgi:methylaspartate mutase epsilon subunit
MRTEPSRPVCLTPLDGAPSPGMRFGAVVGHAVVERKLLVQPRMGMATPDEMRVGLQAVKAAKAATVGTITLDSYTRGNDDAAVLRALSQRDRLNGYPIVVHGSAVTARQVDSVREEGFAIQVRHGSAAPLRIFRTMAAAGLDATEGGPLSYCLPYSRTPVHEAVANWAESCEFLSKLREHGAEPHLETFGGCMLGQLCPPSLLVAVSVLEALFFRQHGLRSVSLSYAQQANAEQDREAIAVLRELADELLDDVDHHVVLYTYMGVFPSTEGGALLLLADAARLAIRSGIARLIVKTVAEAYRIPTIAENIAALEFAAEVAAAEGARDIPAVTKDTGIRAEARLLIDTTLDLDPDIGRALVIAMRRGLLDIPYCLHPDNRGHTRTYLDHDGRLYWAEIGALPLPERVTFRGERHVGSAEFLRALRHVASIYDSAVLPHRLRQGPLDAMTPLDRLH